MTNTNHSGTDAKNLMTSFVTLSEWPPLGRVLDIMAWRLTLQRSDRKMASSIMFPCCAVTYGNAFTAKLHPVLHHSLCPELLWCCDFLLWLHVRATLYSSFDQSLELPRITRTAWWVHTLLALKSTVQPSQNRIRFIAFQILLLHQSWHCGCFVVPDVDRCGIKLFCASHWSLLHPALHKAWKLLPWVTLYYAAWYSDGWA